MDVKILIILILAFFLIGCGSEVETVDRYESFCNDTTIQARSEFTLTCIKNANPLSDEEPEDMISECNKVAKIIHCPEIVVSVTRQDSFGDVKIILNKVKKNK